jgi:uncharacterized delta-60 repeat protein
MKKTPTTMKFRSISVGAVCSIAIALAVCSFAGSVMAQACVPASLASGSLDTCFGSGGKVTTALSGSTTSSAQDVAIQTDGKVVVLANGFQVLRYNSNGLLDSSFGSGGLATLSFIKSSGDTGAYALAIQSDGKIIVAGYATIKGSTVGFAVARLNSNGSLDNSFGSGGKVLFNFQSNISALARGVTIQSNGYIVVAGDSEGAFAVARLAPNGAFDSGFNGSGKVTVSVANSTDGIGGAYDVTTQKVLAGGVLQEKIVAAGIRPRLAVVDRDIAVLRFNPNGSLDSSFGSGGKVFTNFTGYSDQAKAVAIDANNNIVVAGHTLTSSVPGGQRFALVRYTENGQLDTGFGTGGRVTAGTPGYGSAIYGHALAIQTDGRIIASGYVETADFAYADFAVVRVNADGTPDTSFGVAGTGIVLTDFYGDRDRAWGGSALQADGRLVVVGSAYPLPAQVALARYMP